MSIKVTIDNRECIVPPGTTILEAAMTLGIHIPTLCYSRKESDPESHSSSCSVCLVFNETENRLVTACDTRIYEPVLILTGNRETLLSGRKQSIELLLSEHIGDCIGPCVITCPANLDIPEILKQAWIGSSEKLVELLGLHSNGSSFPCFNCPAPCLKVCRRRQIDRAVPVQHIMISLFECFQERLQKRVTPPEKPVVHRFKVITGRIRDDEERQIYLQASLEKRYSPSGNAPAGAGTCLQCSCNARDNCELRDLAEQNDADSRMFRTGSRAPLPPVRIFGKLLFQSGKCVHCRRCEVTAENKNIAPVPRVWYRGYRSIMNFKKGEYDMVASKILAEACPTGALSVNDYDL